MWHGNYLDRRDTQDLAPCLHNPPSGHLDLESGGCWAAREPGAAARRTTLVGLEEKKSTHHCRDSAYPLEASAVSPMNAAALHTMSDVTPVAVMVGEAEEASAEALSAANFPPA